MDGTRSSDLVVLHGVLNNPDESEAHKRQAAKAITRIKRKMNDPFITSTRSRLVKAQRAGDVAEVEKMSSELAEYERRTYGRG